MDSFEQFRAAYPAAKRNGGEHARGIFDKALAKAPLATLLTALEEDKRSEQWQIPRYIPLMTNWLLREQWHQRETPPAPIAPVPLSPADQAQRWRSLSPQEQLRRMGYK